MTAFSKKQGQYLTFIHAYRILHRQAPSEADLKQYFQTSSASVHQMLVRLQRLGLIERISGQPRSLKVLLEQSQIPSLF